MAENISDSDTEGVKNFDNKVLSYNAELEKMVKSNKGNEMLAVGVIVTLLAAVILAYLSGHYNCDCDRYAYAGIVICVLFLLVAIVCFLTYKSTKQKQAKFQEEKILFRDLVIAMNLAEQLPPDLVKSDTVKSGQKHEEDVEKSENKYEDRIIIKVSCKAIMQEKIIQTLLSRYSN